MMRSPNSTKCQSYPDLTTGEEGNINVSQRKRKQPECELTQAISTLSEELKMTMNALRNDMSDQFSKINTNISNLKEEFSNLSSSTAQIQSDLKELHAEFSNIKKDVTDLNKKYSDLSNTVTDLKSSINFNSANNIDTNKRIAEMELKMCTSEAITTTKLESKLDMLDQQARQCNIEIGNMPEKRGENLISILMSIASAINIPLSQQDIVSVHRVPHAHTQNTRPKNIIVKLTSRLLRDNILSAYRLSKGITTDRIGIAGTQHRVYMSEHLTLRNKELFRKCRVAAKTYKYKYVWVRNATILVKEMDDSPTLAIRTDEDIITKIKYSNNHVERS